MNIMHMNGSTQRALALDTIDFINADGYLVQHAPLRCVMVTEEADLAALTALYTPGTIAITAGGAGKWQLSAAGTWEAWA